MKLQKKTDLKKICLFVLFCLTLSCFFIAPVFATEENNREIIFQKAQNIFNKALLLKGEEKRILMFRSALQFESLVREHQIKNGYLYYNIGNAYYEAEEFGKSILNYRRAQALIPDSTDLKKNLELARDEIKPGRAEETWGAEVLKNLLFWHYTIPFSVRNHLFIAVFVLFWILLMVSIFKKHIFLFSTELITAILILALGGSIGTNIYADSNKKEGVILAKQAVPRKGPGLGYQRFFEEDLLGGTEFVILEERNHWWKVQLQNGKEFWLKGKLLDKI